MKCDRQTRIRLKNGNDGELGDKVSLGNEHDVDNERDAGEKENADQ